MENNDIQLQAMLSVRDLIELFKISKAGVYRLIEKRQIPFYKIGGVLRFDRNDVMEFLNKNRVETMENKARRSLDGITD